MEFRGNLFPYLSLRGTKPVLEQKEGAIPSNVKENYHAAGHIFIYTLRS